MRSICAWCREELHRDPAAGPEEPVSHGICERCVGRFAFQSGVPLATFLDSLEAPVVVVDGEGRIRTANARARRLLGKDPSVIDGRAGGDVFECSFTALPEGCGRTVHCSGCTIRKSVMHTHQTGSSLDRVPATLHHGSAVEPQRVPLRISTERVGGLVLLRIDEMAGKAA